MDTDELSTDLAEIAAALSVNDDGLDCRPGNGGDAVRIVLWLLDELREKLGAQLSGYHLLIRHDCNPLQSIGIESLRRWRILKRPRPVR